MVEADKHKMRNKEKLKQLIESKEIEAEWGIYVS